MKSLHLSNTRAEGFWPYIRACDVVGQDAVQWMHQSTQKRERHVFKNSCKYVYILHHLVSRVAVVVITRRRLFTLLFAVLFFELSKPIYGFIHQSFHVWHVVVLSHVDATRYTKSKTNKEPLHSQSMCTSWVVLLARYLFIRTPEEFNRGNSGIFLEPAEAFGIKSSDFGPGEGTVAPALVRNWSSSDTNSLDFQRKIRTL